MYDRASRFWGGPYAGRLLHSASVDLHASLIVPLHNECLTLDVVRVSRERVTLQLPLRPTAAVPCRIEGGRKSDVLTERHKRLIHERRVTYSVSNANAI